MSRNFRWRELHPLRPLDFKGGGGVSRSCVAPKKVRRGKSLWVTLPARHKEPPGLDLELPDPSRKSAGGGTPTLGASGFGTGPYVANKPPRTLGHVRPGFTSSTLALGGGWAKGQVLVKNIMKTLDKDIYSQRNGLVLGDPDINRDSVPHTTMSLKHANMASARSAPASESTSFISAIKYGGTEAERDLYPHPRPPFRRLTRSTGSRCGHPPSA